MLQAICPICSGDEQNYLFTVLSSRVHRCNDCGFVRMSQESSAALSPERGDWAGYDTELDAAERYASTIAQLCAQGKVLVVCAGPHPLGQALRAAGLEVEYSSPTAFAKLKGSFSAVVFLASLERMEEPKAALEHAGSLMNSGGVLFIATPSIDSRAAKLFGRSWVHWRSKNINYFSPTTIQLLLEQTGFGKIWLQPDRRVFDFEHVTRRLQETNFKLLAKAARAVYWVMPRGISHYPIRLSTSGLLVTALKTGTSEAPSLSIIMPAYNERPTVAAALSAVLEKEVAGIARKEIIVVESNSTDGTRDVVRSFEGRPGLKIIYEDAPKGKGHAVRAGFEHATGDIVIIQDADTEYDINDYDELLQPILRWQQLFVLGSRHQGDWKMRTFTDDPAMSALFNFGQVLFTWLMNTLYQQTMTDPFTMYKVFRRECLFGLSFECNRFDFDHEIVIKFLRKGYRPFEVPVNYCSRSYSEGKKVTIIGDPLLWIKANFKFRLVSPFKPMRQAYREARKEMSKGNAKHRVNGEAMAAANVIDFSITGDSAMAAVTLNEIQSSTAVRHKAASEANS
jgi:glycosyltransferase involved in cell wall biosynthesis